MVVALELQEVVGISKTFGGIYTYNAGSWEKSLTAECICWWCDEEGMRLRERREYSLKWGMTATRQSGISPFSINWAAEREWPSFTLQGLCPHTEYRFRISATNDIGTSAFSVSSLSVITLTALPDAAPKLVKMVPIKEDVVAWFDPPKDTWNGPQLSVNIKSIVAGKIISKDHHFFVGSWGSANAGFRESSQRQVLQIPSVR